jgi:hypothetical protein
MVQRRYNDAIPVLQQVRSIAGDKAGDRIEINLVLALNSVGRTSEGLTVARKRAEKRPKDPYSQLLLGDTARIAGQLPEAEKAYKQAATLAPKNRNAQIGLSYVATLKGDRKTAAGILQKLTSTDLSAIKYYHFTEGTVDGVDSIISRTGYTGEDGFEVYAAPQFAEQLWNKLMATGGYGSPEGILPCGLAARNTGSTIGSIRNVSVQALTKNMADELAPKGIQVVCVHPSLTRTEKTPGVIERQAKAQNVSAAEVEKKMASKNLVGKLITSEDIAYLCVFLASPKGIAVNGDAIAAGGGWPGVIYY